MLVLDTSAIIEIVHGTSKGKLILEKIGKEPAATTALNVFEIFRNVNQSEIEVFRNSMFSLNILDFDSMAALESAAIEKELAKSGNKINLSDILIAGICKKHNWAIVTLDEDFAKVNGLNVIVL